VSEHQWILRIEKPHTVEELKRRLERFQARMVGEQPVLELSARAMKALEAEIGSRPTRVWGVEVRKARRR